MFADEGELFEINDNELQFLEICEKLKNHPFESPWKRCFSTTEATLKNFCGVHELDIPDTNEFNSFSDGYSEISMHPKEILRENNSEEFEVQLSHLKESLLRIQKTSNSGHLNGIELLNNISLSQVSELCVALQTILSEEAIMVAFFDAILNLKKSLSLSIANALVKHIIYPQVFHIKQNSSRNLLAVVLKFSETYPKPVIDEIIVPCLNQSSLETLQLETLLKMVKTNLPSEYVGYCMKSILECAMQIDSTFSILQNLIERKIHHEHTLLEYLIQKIESWSLASKKNVKFTKLLISVLITYGSELNQQQITTCNDAIKINETLMKRAAENVIKQLKTQ